MVLAALWVAGGCGAEETDRPGPSPDAEDPSPMYDAGAPEPVEDAGPGEASVDIGPSLDAGPSDRSDTGSLPDAMMEADAGEGAPHMLTFVEDTEGDFLNPERGWVGHGTSYADARARGFTVVWTNGYAGSLYRLDDFRDAPIPVERIMAIDDDMALARQHGIKLKVRFSYTGNPDNTAPDASEQRILAHIAQLRPVLRRNTDVIAVLDAGFFGRWGENHSSSHGISDRTPAGVESRGRIFRALLDALSVRRMLGLRYPHHVRELFGEAPFSRADWFTETDRARVGWVNDCFLADRTNIGTFDYSAGEAIGDLDRATFAGVGRYAATSGESCDLAGLTPYSECAASIAEMELMGGPDLLNRDFWEDTYDRWARDGCYDEISRRLGYRLVLVRGQVPSVITPGERYTAMFTIRNRGFGKVYNARRVQLLFLDEQGRGSSVSLTDDARPDFPVGGEERDVSWSFMAPPLRPGGRYELFLRLPDLMPSLGADARYALRFANQGMWDPETGHHALGVSVVVR